MTDALRALLQAAMRRAEGEDLGKLILCFPEIWALLRAVDPMVPDAPTGKVSHNGHGRSDDQRVPYRLVRRR